MVQLIIYKHWFIYWRGTDQVTKNYFEGLAQGCTGVTAVLRLATDLMQ